MFYNAVSDNDLKEIIKQWSEQFSDKEIEEDELEPFPEEHADYLASNILQDFSHFSEKDSYLSELNDKTISVDISFRKEDIGRKFFQGNISDGRVTKDIIIDTRIKAPESLEKKILWLFRDFKNNTLDSPYEITDLLRGRIIIGKTDETDRTSQTGDNPESSFMPSPVLSEAMSFEYDHDAEYDGTNYDNTLAKLYNNNLIKTINHLRHIIPLGQEEKQRPVSEIVRLYGNKDIISSITENHLDEIALMIAVHNLLLSNKKTELYINHDYNLSMKPSGYSSNHLVFRTITEPRFLEEIQLRTGWQHVFAEHKSFAGNYWNQKNVERKSIIGIIPDYISIIKNTLSQINAKENKAV